MQLLFDVLVQRTLHPTPTSDKQEERNGRGRNSENVLQKNALLNPRISQDTANKSQFKCETMRKRFADQD